MRKAIDKDTVLDIYKNLEIYSVKELVEKYKVSSATVYRIKNGTYKKYRDIIEEYISNIDENVDENVDEYIDETVDEIQTISLKNLIIDKTIKEIELIVGKEINDANKELLKEKIIQLESIINLFAKITENISEVEIFNQIIERFILLLILLLILVNINNI